MKKHLIIISFLFQSIFISSFAEEYYPVSETESVFNQIKSVSVGLLQYQASTFQSIKTSVSSIRSIRSEILDGMATTFENMDSEPAGMDYSELAYFLNSMPLNSIDSRCDAALTSIDSGVSQINSFSLPSTVSVNTSVSSNILYSIDMGIVTNIYEVLAVTENNLQSIMVQLSNDLDTVTDILLRSDLFDLVPILKTLVTDYTTNTSLVLNILKGIRDTIEAGDYDIIAHIDSFKQSFQDWSAIVTNFNNIAFDSSIISNYFGRPNAKYQFDRFSSKLRPTNQGASIDFTFRGPYDSLGNINAANFSALLAGGFSNGLIELASINNYLWFVEKFLTTNQIDNAKINSSLYALSNMVGRIDSYVTEDFSNEFFNLCRNIEGLTNSLNTAIGLSTNSNKDSYFSLTNIESFLTTIISNQQNSLMFYGIFSNDFRTVISNQLRSLAYFPVFSNQFEIVISNQTLFTDYLFSSENVLGDYEGGSYYDFLTNRYITGSSGSSSNWYDRIETLLAALTFSVVAQSNLTTEVEDQENLRQQFQQLLNQAVNQEGQTSIIQTANDSQLALLDIARGLSTTISNIASSQSIVFGWGDSETVKFEDFVGGNFHITISGEGIDTFTAVARAISTICWIVVTCVLVFKFSLWMVRVGYKLYTFIRSVLFALWGK